MKRGVICFLFCLLANAGFGQTNLPKHLPSGFTFRGFGSNANQTPKLPDYAIIDVTIPESDRAPGGGIAATGFFDEQWQFGVE